MRWVFLVDSPDIGGGNFVIFEHALWAQRNGVDIRMVRRVPTRPSSVRWHDGAESLRWCTFEELAGHEVDIAIATFWPTVFDLARLRARTYAYFVQSIESRFYDDQPLRRKFSEASYLVPTSIVTVANWIRDWLWEHYRRPADVVRNGIRKDIFRADGPAVAPRQPGRVRALVEGALALPFKNVDRAIEVCHIANVDEVWLLTPTPVNHYPGVDRTFSRLRICEVAEVYRSCDVLVKLSLVEGMFGPPLEMFHCGGTALTYNVTGHEEYLVHGQNALVVPIGDEEAAVRGLVQLSRDVELLGRLKTGAAATAAGWPDWTTSSQQFAYTLENLPPSTRQAVAANAEVFRSFYDFAEAYRLAAHGSLREKFKAVLERRTPRLLAVLRDLKLTTMTRRWSGLRKRKKPIRKARH